MTTSVAPFVKLPRDLLESVAFRSAGINALRVVHFLMIEHLTHGGRENGNLKAPHRQLVEYGIGAQYVADAIREAEERGLIEVSRGGMRIATTYALTWLPLHDGSPPTNAWRHYTPSTQKSQNLPYKGKAALPYKGKADGPNLPYKSKAEPSEKLPYKGKALSRKGSYQDGAVPQKWRAGAEAPGGDTDD